MGKGIMKGLNVILLLCALCLFVCMMFTEHKIVSRKNAMLMLYKIDSQIKQKGKVQSLNSKIWKRNAEPVAIQHCNTKHADESEKIALRSQSSQHGDQSVSLDTRQSESNPKGIGTTDMREGHDSSVPYAKTRYAIVSLITSDNMHWYFTSALKLARSARWWFPPDQMDLLLMVTEGFGITQQDVSTLHQEIGMLREAGWNIICRISVIEQPGPPVNSRFHDARVYSKLNIWAFTEYDAVLFLDSDTLIIRDPVKLFSQHLPAMRKAGYVLGAARDRPGPLNPVFNTGVLLLRTEEIRRNASYSLDDLKAKIGIAGREDEYVDQGFLNAVYVQRIYELPYIYNGNLVSKQTEADFWYLHENKISIVHYTVSKGWQSFRNFWSNNGVYAFPCWLWNTDDFCQLWDKI